MTGRTRIVFDSAVQRLEFRLSDLRVGRLPLPTGLVLGAVDDLLPEGLHGRRLPSFWTPPCCAWSSAARPFPFPCKA